MMEGHRDFEQGEIKKNSKTTEKNQEQKQKQLKESYQGEVKWGKRIY